MDEWTVQSSWNVMAHGKAREWKWRGNWRMEWVASTLYTTSKHGVSSITTTDAHTSAASSRLNWRPCQFQWTRTFRRKTKSGFCACAIAFQTWSTHSSTNTVSYSRRFESSHTYTGFINIILYIYEFHNHWNRTHLDTVSWIQKNYQNTAMIMKDHPGNSW